jgi:hypothetical protein
VYTVASTASSALAATHHQVAPTSALATVQLTKAQFKKLFDEFSELRRIENKIRSDERKKKQQHKRNRRATRKSLDWLDGQEVEVVVKLLVARQQNARGSALVRL